MRLLLQKKTKSGQLFFFSLFYVPEWRQSFSMSHVFFISLSLVDSAQVQTRVYDKRLLLIANNRQFND